jgi:aspartyl-tRNA(Asn)/glutamyl-tRNA(Gln) amidotransferase subunit C
MALTIDDVRKIATLARLRLTAEEEATFAGQLGTVVQYIDQLQAFDAGRASEPGPPGLSGDGGNGSDVAAGDAREAADQTVPCLGRQEFLRNAPQTLDAFLVVPAVKAGGGDDQLS